VARDHASRSEQTLGRRATLQGRRKRGEAEASHYVLRGVPTEFAARVLAVVRRIPPGRVATYGDVAEAAGRPRAARAVGNIMRSCRTPGVPCHRVIASGGQLGGYGGNLGLKRELLKAEGIAMRGRRVARFRDIRWRNRR
jgi:methylated-DNA-[protein]-cysteine S-methyltransferase